MDLNDRQKQLLKAVIELYAKNGEPVASETIERGYDLGISPATILIPQPAELLPRWVLDSISLI